MNRRIREGRGGGADILDPTLLLFPPVETLPTAVDMDIWSPSGKKQRRLLAYPAAGKRLPLSFVLVFG